MDGRASPSPGRTPPSPAARPASPWDEKPGRSPSVRPAPRDLCETHSPPPFLVGRETVNPRKSGECGLMPLGQRTAHPHPPRLAQRLADTRHSAPTRISPSAKSRGEKSLRGMALTAPIPVAISNPFGRTRRARGREADPRFSGPTRGADTSAPDARGRAAKEGLSPRSLDCRLPGLHRFMLKR